MIMTDYCYYYDTLNIYYKKIYEYINIYYNKIPLNHSPVSE